MPLKVATPEQTPGASADHTAYTWDAPDINPDYIPVIYDFLKKNRFFVAEAPSECVKDGKIRIVVDAKSAVLTLDGMRYNVTRAGHEIAIRPEEE